jgi:hypothetical protein
MLGFATPSKRHVLLKEIPKHMPGSVLQPPQTCHPGPSSANHALGAGNRDVSMGRHAVPSLKSGEARHPTLQSYAVGDLALW